MSGMATVAEAEATEGLTWAQQHGLPRIKATLGTAASECPTRQQKRPVLSPCSGTVSQGAQLTA